MRPSEVKKEEKKIRNIYIRMAENFLQILFRYKNIKETKCQINYIRCTIFKPKKIN